MEVPTGTIVIIDEGDYLFIDKTLQIRFVNNIATKTKAKATDSREIVIGLTATAQKHMAPLEYLWLS